MCVCYVCVFCWQWWGWRWWGPGRSNELQGKLVGKFFVVAAIISHSHPLLCLFFLFLGKQWRQRFYDDKNGAALMMIFMTEWSLGWWQTFGATSWKKRIGSVLSFLGWGEGLEEMKIDCTQTKGGIIVPATFRATKKWQKMLITFWFFENVARNIGFIYVFFRIFLALFMLLWKKNWCFLLSLSKSSFVCKKIFLENLKVKI